MSTILSDAQRRVLLVIFAIACFIGVGVCFICNIAINATLTWAMYPLLSSLLALVVLAPLLLVRKRPLAAALGALSIAILPYLWLMQMQTPVGGWFMSLGLPIALMGIAALWISLWLCKVLRRNVWYLLSILVLFHGLVLSSGINYVVDSFVGMSPSMLEIVIDVFSSVLASIALAVIGYWRGKNGKMRNGF